MDRDRGLEHLQQVPGDRLALAVLVSGQQQLVDVGEHPLQLSDLGLLVRADQVERLEAVLDVDAEPGPLLLLVLGGDVSGALGEVADVADAGLDLVPLAEVPADRLGLGRRLDDHQASRHALVARRHVGCSSSVGSAPLEGRRGESDRTRGGLVKPQGR